MSFEELNDLALEVPCPYCKAPTGQWCTTSGGHNASYLHASRRWPVDQAYGMGYIEGEHDAKYSRWEARA